MTLDRLRRLGKYGYEAICLYEGGVTGPKGSAPAPVVTPPPQAPEASSAAMLTNADEGELELEKKKAKTQGAKSLQIPIGGQSYTSEDSFEKERKRERETALGTAGGAL